MNIATYFNTTLRVNEPLLSLRHAIFRYQKSHQALRLEFQWVEGAVVQR